MAGDDCSGASVVMGYSAGDLLEARRVGEVELSELSTWCLARQDLPRYSSEQLAAFLVACDNDLEAAKSCAKAYCDGRNACPRVFTSRRLEGELLEQTRAMVFAISTHRTSAGEAVLVLRPTSNWRLYSNALAMKLFFMCVDRCVWLAPPGGGLVLLVDTGSLSLGHVVRTDLQLTRALLAHLHEGLHTRLAHIHLLNVNWLARRFLALLSPFIQPHIYSLLRLHGRGEDYGAFFSGRVSPECLPQEFGGLDLPLDELANQLCRTLNSPDMQQYFEQEELVRNINTP